MPAFRLFSFFTLTAAVAYGQAIPSSPPGRDHVISLDAVVVSAGLLDKTAFDLAQGTSILAGDELRRQTASTLGDTLAALPGINSTSYGPGASRPIIRGLGGDRVRVLDGGVGTLDASSISPDHNTAIEPLFAERIEVLRGPATLFYGSSAVGGVVNVIDNRIPATPTLQPIGGAIELRGFGAARERTAVGAITRGSKDWRVQVNGLTSRTRDMRIPSVARIDADAPPDQSPDLLPNSGVDTTSGSIGVTRFWENGRIGAAVSTYTTDYGVPVGEPIGIALRQRRLDLSGETTGELGVSRGAKVRFGFGDYEHREIADRTTTNTTFKNQAWEGRLELSHAIATDITGVLGAQAARSDFSADGEEVVTPPYLAASAALFALEEWKRGPFTWQAGARIERQSITLREFDPSRLPALPGYFALPNLKRNHRGLSGSLGAVYYPAKDWSVGFALAYTERLPTAQELFSNGPHGGTGAYEVGTSGLANEKSLGLELSLRRRAGFVTGTASVFVNTFENFIFEQELSPSSIPEENNPDGLTPYQFTAKDAKFHGAEAELTLHLIEKETGQLHLNLTADTVRAQQTVDDIPLPRIPPARYGVGFRFIRAAWSGGIEVRHTRKQSRITSVESPTAGFTLLNADFVFRVMRGHATWEFFVRGTNLTDATARLHSSFLKDFAPLAGRSVMGGVRVNF